MGIAERKKREKAELRSRILEAAEHLFVREGYAHVSMRKIAQAIEYSPTTIYRYFESKDEIMEHLMTRGYEGVRERYLRVMEDPGDDPFLTLSRIIREYVDFGLTHPNHYLLWHSAGEFHEEDGGLVMSRGGRRLPVYDLWLDLIRACVSRGQLSGGDPLELFKLIWGCVHGLISLRLQHAELRWPDPEVQVTELLSLLKRGLRPAS